MLAWDDLRFFLAVARSGSLSAAARELGVNHATVSRRIRALEENLDRRLFDRSAGGFTTTAAGERMRETAERVEEEMVNLDRQILGEDARLSGTLRIAIAEVGLLLLMPDFACFHECYPDIELEIVADEALANLTRREADVAVRATHAPPEHLVGRRVGTARSAIYASRALLDRVPDPPDLRSLPYVSWDESHGSTRAGRWLQANAPRAPVHVRTNTPGVLLEAVRQGMGAAPMLCLRGDAFPELVRVTEPLPEFDIGLWLLTHPDLRRTARVRAFMDFMGEHLATRRERLEGRAPDQRAANITSGNA